MDEDSKIPIKMAQISIQKFNEVGIPHHLGLLRNHKTNIRKCLALSDWDKIKKEEINATRVIKQLKNLLIEMDGLRGKIQTDDLKRFDELILKSRQDAVAEIKSYMEINLNETSAKSSHRNSYEDSENPIHDPIIPEIQTTFQLSEHQLRSREACLAEFENLQREVEDLHGMFQELSESVGLQRESVEVVAENIEEVEVQVEQAERHLRQALRYKKAMYPLCGALLGTCVGGPIGFLAGLKAGGLAAVGCGILGFTGGSVIKNKEEQTQLNEEKEQ